MDSNLIHSDATYAIRGAAFEVYNSLGFGHKEIVYQRSLAKVFSSKGIGFLREPKLDVIFRGETVGVYIPDFLVSDKVVVELKSLEYLPPKMITQVENYLKGSNYQVGLLINFGSDKIQITRRVWTKGSAKISPKSE